MRKHHHAEAKGTISVEKKILLDGLGFAWREHVTTSRVNPSSELCEEPEIDDALEDDSAKKSATVVSPSTTAEERPGNHQEMMNPFVLRQGSRQKYSEADDSERPRDQQPAGIKESQKDTRDIRFDNPTSGDAGEMPAGGDFPPGWVMRWKKRRSGVMRGYKDRSWKSPSGIIFRSLFSVQKFLKENAAEANQNDNLFGGTETSAQQTEETRDTPNK